MGHRQATPDAAAIRQAHGLLTRLIASGTVVGLNLLGTVSEQPDFLAHSQALPFVLSLRADRDWKHAPQKSSGHKVSPLVLELWKVLDKDGALTAADAREALGRELTEAAVLRALCELWQALRISPVFAEEGQPASWEMLRVRHREALTTASATGQVTALSLLVSMYLQSVYAASSDEIEIFLSPVASRSRVREAVRGLSATRQIHSLSMDAQTYHFLENGLPEFAELPAPAVTTTLPSAIGSEANGTETERRPAPRPVPRKVQATRPKPSDSPAVPAAAPIFRRTKHVVPPGVEREMRPEVRPESRAAAAARPDSTGRPPARPAGQPTARPPARGARWTGKDQGARGGRTARPTAGAPFPPARTFSSPSGGRGKTSGTRPDRGTPRSATRPYTKPYDRPGGAPPDARRGASYGARPGSRPGARLGSRVGSRVGSGPSGAWTGSAKKETPKPWALPGRPSGSSPRPPRANARGAAPFRPARKPYDRPSAGLGGPRADADRPRAPRGERGPGDPARGRSSRPPGGPQGRPQRPPYVANRPSGPAGGRSSAGPQAGVRPQGGPRSGGEGRGGPRSGDRKTGFNTPGRRFSPAPGTRAPGASRPQPSADAPPQRRGPIADARPNRSAGNDRPRPGGYAKSGAKPRPGGATGRDPGRNDRAARPPFVPRSGPAKSAPRKFKPGAGSTPGKPGKPSFRGRKPDRNNPGQ
jgi:23S rRNA pseudouridine2605 synthase